MLSVKDLTAMDEATLLAQVEETRKELFGMKMEKKTSGLEKSHRLKVLKSDVARALTILRQKKETK
jgi:large subunit ribosomal protein L29